jgi:hypothetical protein
MAQLSCLKRINLRTKAILRRYIVLNFASGLFFLNFLSHTKLKILRHLVGVKCKTTPSVLGHSKTDFTAYTYVFDENMSINLRQKL